MSNTLKLENEEGEQGLKSDRFLATMSSNAMGFSPSRTIIRTVANAGSGATMGERSTGKEDILDCGAVRTARFKAMKPCRFPINISSNTSNSSGIRLIDLLDSPILWPSNQQAEPSPTTGTSPLSPIVQGSSSTPVSPSDPVTKKRSAEDAGQIIIYKPVSGCRRNGVSSLSGIDNNAEDAEEVTTKPLEWVAPLDTCKVVTPLRMLCDNNTHEMPKRAEQDQFVVHTQPNSSEISSEDGYHWRKYGQKAVKNSNFPRSYYRCAHPNCPVKKMVEETKVVYKGMHDHPTTQQQTLKRNPTSVLHSLSRNSSDSFHAIALRTDDSYEQTMDTSTTTTGDKGLKPCTNGITQVSEPVLASASVCEGASAERRKVNDTQDILLTNDHGNNKDDCRKKLKIGETASKMSFRTFREPRCVERRKCYSNVVDDGYRWCKYGQKRIKGNPHPRSYYKCHNPGCPVRKHVERSSTDEMTIISTYEGKHNHEAPSSRLNNSNTVPGSFITAITLPTVGNTPSSILGIDLQSQDEQCDIGSINTSSDDRMVGDIINNNSADKPFGFDRQVTTSGFQASDGSSDQPIDDGKRNTVVNAPPLSSHLTCQERAVPIAFNFLKSGIDAASDIRKAESPSLRQGPSMRYPKVEPSEVQPTSNLLRNDSEGTL